MSMTIEESGMKFPVLRVNKMQICKIRSKKRLATTSQKYFGVGGFMKNTDLIDVEGNRFRIETAEVRRRSYNPLNWFAPSRILILDVKVNCKGGMALEQIRDELTALVVKNKWYRQGYQNEKQFRNMLNEAHTIEELFGLISAYGKYQG